MEVDDQAIASSLEQEMPQPTQSPNVVEDNDPEPIWRLFGESLAPESAPQSDDPGWAVFRTTVPHSEGVYRSEGERNARAWGSYAEVMKSIAWFEGTVCVKVSVNAFIRYSWVIIDILNGGSGIRWQ